MSSLASQFSGGAVVLDKQFVGDTNALAEGNAIVGPLDVQQYDRYTAYVKSITGTITGVKLWTSPDGISNWVEDSNAIAADITDGVTKYLSFNSKSYKYIKISLYHAQTVTASTWVSVGGAS